ncbi:unnamed protein product [Eruca vesicaria subsp. sativa]|uniref:S-protein homolog n=1 Tax=Eruca vesicaria subsp. sativa TaxID=29727 RepID=A0ABC8IV23_ERUVS|nr:unnamed protein product [Eruca vesicaria subsp. sativa]
MAKMKKLQVYVVVISLFIHLAAASRVEGIYAEKTVKIINRIGGGLTLTLHCKSKNNDLGVHTLAPDTTWSFKFSPNVFGTTLIFCNFKWAGESHWFNIYDDGRDDNGGFPCDDCTWNIKRTSPCRYDSKTNSFDLCYGWNKNFT